MPRKFVIILGIFLLLLAALGLFITDFLLPKSQDSKTSDVIVPSKGLLEKQQAELRNLFQPLTSVRSSSHEAIEIKPRENQLLPEQGLPGPVAPEQRKLNPDQLLQGNQNMQRATEFRKIDFDGHNLPDSSHSWSCARDLKTGLLWETKLFNAGLSDADHRYSWYDPASSTPGVKNGGSCYGIECDTYAYTVEMNRLGLCGSKQWRLPSFAELETILDRDYFYPVINQQIFTYTRGASYWTRTQLKNNPRMIMQIDFFNGSSSPAPIYFKLAVRLVSE